MSEFDRVSESYDEEIDLGLSLTGEDKSYYAYGRIAWLASKLKKYGFQPRTAMDFGCGTGASSPILADMLNLERVAGIDISPKCLEVARREHDRQGLTYCHPDEFHTNQDIDLAYCNGVFHHIPGEQRGEALQYIRQGLRPGGMLALWENNPYNPAVRWIMKKVPFDRDAVMLWPGECREMISGAGFRVLETSYLFIFPRWLGALRRTEPWFSRLPLGGQYMVLALKN